MARLLIALVAGTLLLSAAAPTHAPLTGIEPIVLHYGANLVPRFASDGREALIVKGWRDNGNAYSYPLFLILIRPRPEDGMDSQDGGGAWNVVQVHADYGGDTIGAAPHTGEDFVRSVRFVRAAFRGKRQVLMLIATRSPQGPIPDPAPTRIAILTLQRFDGGVGSTADYFEAAQVLKASRLYCNADMALKTELGIPLPPDYGGSKALDGCL